MNAGPADTRSPHLDLADLIAEAAGQATDDGSRDHLATCAHCRAEASRWNLVADGVRGLAVATPEVAPSAWSRRTRSRVLTGPRRRRTMMAASAAAALVLGVAGYWAASDISRPEAGPILTAVNGCAGTELATGKLERVNGTSLVIGTGSGQRVTVTTTGLAILSVAGSLLSDITDGAPVIVLGPSSGGTMAAISVIVGPPPGTGNDPLNPTPPPGWSVARGTVADASASGFTAVTSDGARVRVATSASTFVIVPHASLGQLRAGVTTVAVGHAGPGGTLTAQGVLQQPPGPLQVHLNLTGRGCPPASVDNALAAALASAD